MAKATVLLLKRIRPIASVLCVALIVLLVMQVLCVQSLPAENTITSTGVDGSIYSLYTIH